jgi:hypothetical protein
VEQYELYQKLPEKQRKTVTFPDQPDVMEWLERVEKWGLPNPGTFLDQPMEFLADIEAAERGKSIAMRTLGAAENLFVPDIDNFDLIFAGAPKPEALRTR